jgi:hypothetical protein
MTQDCTSRYTGIGGVLAFVAVVMLPASLFCQSRTWTSDQGSTVRAELVDIGTNSVTLTRTDGKGNITVLIRKLSQADQAFIAHDWAAERMSNAVIPEINFRQTPLADVLQFFTSAARPVTKKSPVLMFRLHEGATNTPPVTLVAKQIGLRQALRTVTGVTGTKYAVDGKTVLVMMKDEPEGPMIDRTYPFTLSLQQVQRVTNGDGTDQDVKKFLEMMGVELPKGSQVQAHWDSREIHVRTTEEGHSRMARMTGPFAPEPFRVEHLTRLWEISNADATRLTKGLPEDAVPPQQMPDPHMRKALEIFESIRKSEITAFQKVLVGDAKEHERKRVGDRDVTLESSFQVTERGIAFLVSTELVVASGKRTAKLAAARRVMNGERFLTLAQEREDGPGREGKWYVMDIIVRLVDRAGRQVMPQP